MEIVLPVELRRKLDHVAAERGRDVGSLVLEAVERLVSDDAWFSEQVQRGLASADRGEFVEEKERERRVDRLITERLRR